MSSDSVTPVLERQLAADVATPAQARAIVRRMLRVWDAERERDVVQLLTSELVTNAVRHAATEIVLRVAVEDAVVRVEVMDRSERMPRLRHDPGVGGYGLRIVDELATRWGVDQIAEDGKSVWFELEVSAPAV